MFSDGNQSFDSFYSRNKTENASDESLILIISFFVFLFSKSSVSKTTVRGPQRIMQSKIEMSGASRILDYYNNYHYDDDVVVVSLIIAMTHR